MKPIVIVMLSMLAATIPTRAGDSEDALRGGLVGAAFGALLGEIDDSIDVGTTIPVFAGLGALTGYAWDRDWDRHHRGHYRYRHGSYGNRRRRYRYWDEYPWRYPRLHLSYPVAARTEKTTNKKKRVARPAPATPNRHPGVSLVTVPITLKNGMVVDIRILKLGDRYFGPKGEAYDTKPSPEVLASRYSQ